MQSKFSELLVRFTLPIYVLEEERLRRNLSLIKSVAERADMEIILAFKAYALVEDFSDFQRVYLFDNGQFFERGKTGF